MLPRPTPSPVQFRPDMLLGAIGVGLDWPPAPPRAIGGWRGSHPDTKKAKMKTSQVLVTKRNSKCYRVTFGY